MQQTVFVEKSPNSHKVIPILLKLTKCVETNVNDLPLNAKHNDIMREELDSRTQDKDLALILSFYLTVKADGHALLLKVALDMADVKVEPGTNDEQPSDTLPPLPIVPALLNIGDDNDKTVDTPNKKAKVNVDMDDWLQDVVCIGES
ncbi:hypothetical protein CHS0354_032891 [Potamilus streckersoni]|uniref:Uncharacterized protein n=1 Tax=Potamilus streckersoni TaxID=2493646 RepID=A0AAE0RWB1_9BIVA|nr:hypothetical protein CHS0354_032891 [Potamilus streckersoni]